MDTIRVHWRHFGYISGYSGYEDNRHCSLCADMGVSLKQDHDPDSLVEEIKKKATQYMIIIKEDYCI